MNKKTKKERQFKKALARVGKEFEGLASIILDVAQTGRIPADYKQRMGTYIESQIGFLERRGIGGEG